MPSLRPGNPLPGRSGRRPHDLDIRSLDQLVITASDLEARIDFHAKVPGMEHVALGNNLQAVQFGAQKFNIHDGSTGVCPKARNIVSGSEDFGLISETPVSPAIQNPEDRGVGIEEPPVR